MHRALSLLKCSSPATVVLAAAFVFTAAVARGTPEPARSQFPATAEEARALDESDLPDWAGGPIALILLEEEKEIWEGLDSDEERERFIDWFWDRRDDDLRDPVNMAKFGFYSRVAEANKRFTNLPRGWRTDRGQVWVMFGKPTAIRSDFEDENATWNYFAPGMQRQLGFDNAAGEFNVYFSRLPPRSYRIAGGVAPGAWPPYVLRMMEFARQNMVVQPDLEWTGRGN